MNAKDKIVHFLSLISEGKYTITDSGDLVRTKTGKMIVGTSRGYKQIATNVNKKTINVSQHRLLFAFYHGIDALDFSLTINHIDGNKLNNDIANLEQISNSENVKHGHKHGIYNQKGENSHRAVLSKSDVLEIKDLLNAGMKHSKIASFFNVGRGAITRINLGLSWKDTEKKTETTWANKEEVKL